MSNMIPGRYIIRMSRNKMKNIRKDDEYETPEYAVKIIEKYLKRNSKIWCPFDKDDSNFVKVLRQSGHDVVNSHIEYGQDFFKAKVKTKFDYIISNPPYSVKDQILTKIYELQIPFALLLNLQGFADSKKRANLFIREGVQVLYIYPRICYIKEGIQTKGNIFQSGYICKNVLPNDLMIEISENK